MAYILTLLAGLVILSGTSLAPAPLVRIKEIVKQVPVISFVERGLASLKSTEDHATAYGRALIRNQLHKVIDETLQ